MLSSLLKTALSNFATSVAAVSSIRGIVTGFRGATRDFPLRMLQWMFPVTSTKRIYDTVPYPSSEASEKWWIWEERSSPKPSGFTDRGNVTPLMLGRSFTHSLLLASPVAHPGSSRPIQILVCTDFGALFSQGEREETGGQAGRT